MCSYLVEVVSCLVVVNNWAERECNLVEVVNSLVEVVSSMWIFVWVG